MLLCFSYRARKGCFGCMRNKQEKKQTKKKSVLWIILVVLLTVPTMTVCAFPYLPLAEGSLPYAVMQGVYAIFEKYTNFFPTGSLSTYGLAPLAAFALLVLITTFAGAGLLSFILKVVAFYSLYLIFAYAQGGKGFEIVGFLPRYYYWIALGVFFLSCLLLICTWLSKRKKNKKVTNAKAKTAMEDVEENASQPEQVGVEATLDNLEDVPNEASEEEIKTVEMEKPKSTLESKEALKSLSELCVPEFEKFPNSLSGTILKPHAGVSIYDVVEREAQIKKEAQEQRRLEEERAKKLEEERQKRKALEEERARKEAEAEKKRLESLFKPRNLLKRLSEDAEAEKNFSSYRGFSDNNSAKNIEVEKPANLYQIQSEYQNPTPVQRPVYQSAVASQAASAVASQVPPSQMINPYAVQFQSSPVINSEPEPARSAEPIEEVKPVQRSEYVDREEKETEKSVFARDMENTEEEEISQVPRASFKDEELRAQSEMEEQQRRREQEKAEQKAEQSKPMQDFVPARPVQEVVQELVRDDADDEAEFEKSKAAYASSSDSDKKKKKEPDIDYVSGVAGLKSSVNNSHLLDADKFVYRFPPESLLKHYKIEAEYYDDLENDPNGKIIVDTFNDFNIGTQLLHIQHGPTFTLYELALQRGVKVSRVTNYAEDVAMNLAVASVRILAPIPGKSAIGIEVPNKKRDTIGFDVMMEALKAKPFKIPMVLGKNITGDSIVIDLTKTPHLLVAGTTGSGKSVCINGLICSVLFTKTPKEVRMLLVDPKMVELSVYNGIPHLLTPVITEPKKALKAMNFIVEEMERRMALFSSVGAKKIEEYNEKIVEKKLARVKLPYIMVIVDEFADLMLTVGKELEASIKRITALARFCGIHLVLATQRPSVDVITGIIKSNIPTQIAFAVSNSQNSRIIIDSNGAEKLLGRGDMLYNSPEFRTPTRIQGAYIDTEIEDVVNFVKTQGEPDYIDESYFEDDEDEEEGEEESASSASEDMFSKAWKIVSDRGEASASYLQRRLNIGYNRAANLIEQMEDAGYIGPARGSKPREILKLYGSD